MKYTFEQKFIFSFRDSYHSTPQPGDCLRRCNCMCHPDSKWKPTCGGCDGRLYCRVNDTFLEEVMKYNDITDDGRWKAKKDKEKKKAKKIKKENT